MGILKYKKIKTWGLGLFSGLAFLFVLGCQPSSESSDAIKVGAIAGPEAELLFAAQKVALEEYDLNFEIVEFQDYVTPNTALADGALDANAYQHQPFLDESIAARGFAIESVANTFVYPIAFYSDKLKSIEDLPDGAKVGVPNDPSNRGRTLLLMEQAGLIELNPNSGLLADVRDVESNPKQLEIIELDAAMLARSMRDLDMAAINTTFASQLGLKAGVDGILVESAESPYVNLIVVRSDDVDEPWVGDLIKSYQSQAVIDKADELFKDQYVIGWSE